MTLAPSSISTDPHNGHIPAVGHGGWSALDGCHAATARKMTARMAWHRGASDLRCRLTEKAPGNRMVRLLYGGWVPRSARGVVAMQNKFEEVRPRTFNPMSAAGLSDEARKAVNAAFDAMSTWRIETAKNSEKNIEQVIEKMAAAARAL